MKYADGNEPGEKKIMKEKDRSICRSKGYENESGWDPKASRGWPLIKQRYFWNQEGRQRASIHLELKRFGRGEMRKSSYWTASTFSMKYKELKLKGNREGFKRLEQIGEGSKLSLERWKAHTVQCGRGDGQYECIFEICGHEIKGLPAHMCIFPLQCLFVQMQA